MEQLAVNAAEVNLPQVTFTKKKQQRLQENRYAKPEPRTQRIMQKLKERLDNLDKKVTPDRISDSKAKIQYWINRHIAHRVQIETQSSNLFSEGRNAAKMSKRVEDLRDALKDGLYQAITGQADLKGRISKTS